MTAILFRKFDSVKSNSFVYQIGHIFVTILQNKFSIKQDKSNLEINKMAVVALISL